MAHQKGSTTILSVGEEGTPGTAATTGFKLPFNSCTVKGTFNRTTPKTLTGTRNPVQPFKGNTNVAGDIVIPVDNEALWYWLQLMFGDPTTSGAGDPYSHVFKVGNTMPYFTLQKAFTDLATDVFYQAVGCKVSSANIAFGGEDELTLTLSVIGMNETSESATAFSSSETTVALDERLNNFDAAVTEGGGASSIIKSMSITIDFGLDGNQRVIGGGGILTSIPEGIVSVTGSITGQYTDGAETIIAKGPADTESALVVTLTSAADSNHTLAFDIGELFYSQSSPDVNDELGLDFTLDFAGFYNNDADASVIKVTLANASAHA